ncbi:hypothetical protein HELRODRAFT_163883 [Helobdella robusta]|uniref:Uncharacterized protein n=1 Tax=Helobdella robusta TaxID=6412 RepID=T1EUK7_HELRO|nr:hypothetical protein HELRODRAFT_163883 [Helobdella robusta]ESN96767.1 hypothetical protein HELRODRAFT_163883 [Helobdella robusta]
MELSKYSSVILIIVVSCYTRLILLPAVLSTPVSYPDKNNGIDLQRNVEEIDDDLPGRKNFFPSSETYLNRNALKSLIINDIIERLAAKESKKKFVDLLVKRQSIPGSWNTDAIRIWG